MNEEKVKGGYDQVKGEAKDQWGKLTDERSTQAEGKFDKAKGKVKEGIGELKDKLK
ncbi:CsbD family protein [Neobacillus mesonae]|uniref:CsbD family protein n=1 Tax=Neobacillus mesonae TaxID=1193713 RepID=A0A3Q9QW35_9BACI|nr:CsbD family protein [Neobacillus mesonae]AZU64578.1 CsbD family protein [Neobacillus mesonae]